MKSSVKNIKLNSVDDLFSTEESRQDANREKVMEIPLVELYEDGYLADVTFEIRAEETITGKDGTVWYQAGETVDTLVTTADGPVSSKALPLGLYQLVEVSAPSGYILQSRPVSVRLSVGDGQKALVS